MAQTVSVVFRSAAALLVSLVMAACLSKSDNWRAENFPIVVGTKWGSDLTPCIDYGSRRNAAGHRYRVQTPDGLIVRHEGMDFCYRAGTPVYAAASGKIHTIVKTNVYRGGWVTQMTDFSATRGDPESSAAEAVYLFYLHIVPSPDLERSQRVEAGDLIGHVVNPAGLPEVGGISHLHFAAGTCEMQYWVCHTDPNRFWQNGPGKITCLDKNDPPKENELVAPIGC